MGIKVLIIDDSSFFRKRLTEIIKGDPGLEVAGEAKDGKEGVEKALSLRPDVITMDVEMPVMDGITAVKEIMSKCPTPILMFSSLTFEGANSTFKALEAGAVDFMPKNFDDIAHKREDALNNLRASIKAVARSHIRRTPPRVSAAPAAVRPTGATVTTGTTSATRIPLRGSTASTSASALGSRTPLRTASSAGALRGATVSAPAEPPVSGSARNGLDRICESLSGVNQGRPAAAMQFSFGAARGVSTNFRVSGKNHELVAIGSSTGGPIALQNIIPKLPKMKVPVVIVQHMPASFTTTFAQRLDHLSQNKVVEAEEGMILEPGCCYIAPGGKQMIFEKAGGRIRVRILPADPRVVYHPCVDVSFASLASVVNGTILAMILTGMGSDGCEGCRIMKKSGSVIWAQNEDTCVVYGMPQAVVNSGLADQILPLDKIADCIIQEMKL